VYPYEENNVIIETKMIGGTSLLDDIQALGALRHLPLQRVGVKGLRYPAFVPRIGQDNLGIIAEFGLFVQLEASKRGAHMSRFVEILHEKPLLLSLEEQRSLTTAMLLRLDASAGEIETRFSYFMEKSAPVSQCKSLMEYQVEYKTIYDGSNFQQELIVCVPVSSVCPCSKAISEYGAHNQRAQITLRVSSDPATSFGVEDLIAIAEEEASCDLFAILKRSDEKYVTEKAYNQAKFVEDVVRDVAHRVQTELGVKAYRVSAENFESIHHHSAYAELVRV
jgi:GTP cyclohydrolase IB